MSSAATWSVADTDRSIPQRFEERARLHPAKTAIDGRSSRVSFGELDAAANHSAYSILERCGEGSGRIALLLRHDVPLFAAVLGVLKAGKVAVVLNPTDPTTRLGRIRAETTPELVLCDPRHRELALAAGFPRADVETVRDPDTSSQPAPERTVGPDELAFLIYTSGSTGRPKGVMQTHRNVLHNVLRHTSGLGVRADDRIALLASLSGGQGVGTTWTALLNAATLCPFPIMERGLTGLPTWIAQRSVTVLMASASLFRHFVRTLDGEVIDGIRLVRVGSEPSTRADLEAFGRHFADTCMFANTLASSETGSITHCLLSADADLPGGRLPVGRPAEGIEVSLLDEHGEAVSTGETGEIVVCSEYLSPGYWRNGALTAKRFVHAGSSGTGRAFRTGDLGRVSVDGLLTVVGRRDRQVKVRGNRVELSEVEAAIAGCPEVAAAAVCHSSTPRGDTKLTAYVTPSPGRSLSSGELRRKLRETLPGHSVPTAFVFLEALPLDPHGAVDRDRLARIQPPRPTSRPADPSMSGIEEALSKIWSDALELERVGREDDFFDLGGDSLTAAVVAAEAYDSFGVELELDAFVNHATLGSMARLVDEMRRESTGDGRLPLTRASRAEPLPASFDQERMWRNSRGAEQRAFATMAVGLRIQGPLDVAALRRSLDHIVRRHEVLRTTFEERDGQVVQLVHPPAPIDLPLIDLTGVPDADTQVDDLLKLEARIPFDLERGPLLRTRLIRIHTDEHRLLRINHHIISDAWSWTVFFDELGFLYEDYHRGDPPRLADERSLQYGDFAAWERRRLDHDERAYREGMAWWRSALQGSLPSAPLPFARPAPRDDAAPSEGMVMWGVPGETSRELDRLGRQAGSTYYMGRLAIFAAHLAMQSGRDDVVLRTHLTKRRRVELQKMFGPFVNPTVIRLRFTPEETFRQWLRRVRDVVTEASAHSEIPYERLCEELEELESTGSVPPQPVFNAGDQGWRHHRPWRFGGLEITTLGPVFEGMPHGFNLGVDRWSEADLCIATFDPRVHDPARVRSFLEGFERLATAFCADPDRPLGQVARGGMRDGSAMFRGLRDRIARVVRH